MSRLASLFLRPPLLALVLAVGTVLGLGSYFETNDDGTLAWLFGGVLAVKPLTLPLVPAPVPVLPLYFHGYGHLLAAAYAAVPGVAWLGWLLGSLLLLATGLFFDVLAGVLRPRLRAEWLAGAAAVFFVVGWLEHWLWFSHGRVALLLAGAALLWAAQRPGRRGPLLLGLAGLLAAWALRPGLAALAAGAVLPTLLLLAGGWRRAGPLLLAAAGLLAGSSALLLATQSAGTARSRQVDACLAQILDYEQLTPAPRTPADSLAGAATRSWLLGDSTLIDPARYRRMYRFAARPFWLHTVPAKLGQRLPLLARDYFPLLLLLLASGAVVSRARRPGAAGFWLAQLWFGGGLLGLAALFKLPPRVALPLLDFWLLHNLVFLVRRGYWPGMVGEKPANARPAAPWLRLLLPGSAGLILAVYGAKTWHRHLVLSGERQRHLAAWAEISRQPRGSCLLLAGANDLLKSLSPFEVCAPGPGPTLLLTGWAARSPAQTRLRRALTGTADQTECLRHLAQPGSGAAWLLSADAARWLSRRARYAGPPHAPLALRRGPALAADTTLRWYRPAVR